MLDGRMPQVTPHKAQGMLDGRMPQVTTPHDIKEASDGGMPQITTFESQVLPDGRMPQVTLHRSQGTLDGRMPQVTTPHDCQEGSDGGMPQATQIAKTSRLDTPVNIRLLAKLTRGFQHANWLINGFQQGFKFHFTGKEEAISSLNSKEANLHAKAVDKKMTGELKAKRIAGPFSEPPFINFKCSPLSVREKSEPGKVRLLHNLSYPYNESSVNGGIQDAHKTVRYATIQTAINTINRLGKGCFMAKTDIKSAYRIVPIHPSQYHLLGLKWRSLYYFDKFLPMGLAESCAIFEKISDAIVFTMNRFGVNNIVKVLDDFLILEASKEKCDCSLRKFKYLCSLLNIPLVEEKTSVTSLQRIIFLGLELDSVAMTAELPKDKLTKYTQDVSLMLAQATTSKKDIQRIVGKLQFSTSVIPIGKPFLRRLIDSIKRHPGKAVITMSVQMKADLRVWLEFLTHYNGRTIIAQYDVCDSTDIRLFTDASNQGWAAAYGSQWIQGAWNRTWKQLNIAVRELYPILAVVKLFGHLWKNQRILFRCDNQAIVAAINRQSVPDPTIMKLLRPLVLHLMLNNIRFTATYIRSKDNVLADAISRFQENNTMLNHYGMRPFPTPVPPSLYPEVFLPG